MLSLKPTAHQSAVHQRSRRTAYAALAVASAAALLAVNGAAAHAAPALAGSFSLTGTPQNLTQGPDGNIWTTLSGATNEVAKITPGGIVTEYDVANLVGAKGITAGPDGKLWVTRTGGVASFDPTNPAAAVATPIAAIADPRGIVAGADGKLWAASGDKAISFLPSNPAGFTTVTVPGMGARGITAAGDGALHIADFGSGRIVKVTTGGVVTSVAVGGGPQEVAAGPGTQVAFANPGAAPHAVGRSDGGAVSGTSAMPLTDPFGLTLGNDGAYWVARFAGNDIARVTTTGEVSTPLGLFPAGSGPRYITRGPDNTLWVGLETSQKVAKITGVEAPATPTPAPTPTPTPTPTTPVAKPFALTGLSLTAKSFALGQRIPGLAPNTAGGRLIRFTLPEAARVTLTFDRVVPGRRLEGRCVRRPASARVGAKCEFAARVKTTVSLDVPTGGLTSIRFEGKLTFRRSLTPGRYRLTVTAKTSDGRTSAPLRTSFRIKTS